MNLFTISSLGGFLSSIAIAVVVSLKASSNDVSRIFIRLVLAAGTWTLFPFASILFSSDSHALLVTRLVYISAFLTGPAFMHFGLCFSGRHQLPLERMIIKLAYVLGLLLTPLVFSNSFINGVHRYQPHFSLSVGPLYPIIIVFFALTCLYSFASLIYVFIDSRGERRNQIEYIFVAYLLAFVSAVIHFATSYGYSEVIPHDILVFICMGLTAYAIIKHHLMDIEVVVKRATVFAGLFAFIYGTFSVLTFIGQKYFESILRLPTWLAMIPTLIIITAAIRPLEKYLTNTTDRFLFQKKYDYKELLNLFTTEVITYLDLEKVAINTVAGLDNIIKLEAVSIWIRNDDGESYNALSYNGQPPAYDHIDQESPLLQWISKSLSYVQKSVVSQEKGDAEKLRECFKELNSELLIPIVFRQEMVGFISMGRKKSGDGYKAEELPLLMSIAGTVGIAISNAKLFAQLSEMQAEAAQKDKMAVIGTLAAGLNHEICNPLGIVRGQSEMFLLNHKDGLFDNMPPEKVVNQALKIFEKVIKETDRATGITKRLSTFAKPSKMFNMEAVDVSPQINEVLDLLRTEMRVENIQVKNTIPEDFPNIMVDKKQLQQVVFNIVRNAAQAMRGEGEIIVSGTHGDGKATVLIDDTGHGISPDRLKSIFNPFFTTKDPGKGTGLGLYIVKQIVERNQGSIACKSEVNKGTTFKLTFNTAVLVTSELIPEKTDE